VKALCDTNIVIDLLGGVQKASRELRKYDELFLSRISWMEVLIGSPDQGTETLWLKWLRNFSILEIDAVVAAEAVRLRKLHRIKLPDAIIWASARSQALILLTRNSRDYPKSDPDIRFPYHLP
jgi:predicted nucleic acid-binding protein